MRPGRLTTMAATLFAVAALTACGSGSGTSQRPTGAAAATPGAGGLKGKQLSFVGFGGETQAAEQASWTDPFARQTGATVRQDGPADYAKLKAQVTAGNVTWDVVEVDDFFADAQCGKLLQPLTPAVNTSQLDPKLITNRCGIPVVYFSYVLAYDKKKFGANPPRSWADFFDTTKYPGKRGLWNYAIGGNFEAALLGDGVKPASLYPLDLRRAIDKLNTIKSDTVFYSDLAQAVQMMSAHQVAMMIVPNGRVYKADQQGADFGMQWSQNIAEWDNLVIPKGSPNSGAAEALLNYVATPAAQAAFTEKIPYAPTAPAAKPKVDSQLKSDLPDFPANAKQAVILNTKWWAANVDQANQVWTNFTSG